MKGFANNKLTTEHQLLILNCRFLVFHFKLVRKVKEDDFNKDGF